ncbi:PGF-CTERM sorting domain-containing protein [Natronoarchaeum rubrum]|uniref:PGF-CTERM sorting domain-containing protein n=1 Tax=Natronoarchaeum rubrum TaxID=755311 RepID=UPI0021138AF4|nr:PGF-CTERM sorting domain-containing protein [Natronoarchaeum rubrum]
MIRKSNAMNVLLVGLVLLATATSGVALGDASIGGEDEQTDAEQSVYLVFGADTASEDLDQWVDEFKNGDGAQVADSTVVQYQDVDQLNVNQQGQAVAISINGGQANAIQQNEQANDNRQIAVAEASNEVVETTSLSNVEQVNVIFAGGENASGGFSGMVVEDGSDDDEDQSSQYSEAEVIQSQEVDQLNFNNQSAAIALAVDNSTATAYQEAEQRNSNTQYAEADATNVDAGGGDGEQEADSDVEQEQDVTQVNVNIQGLAVAIAVGENSEALAVQKSYQYNSNSQVAFSSATNVQTGILGISGMSMAAAAPNVSDDGSANATENGSEGEAANASGTSTESVEQNSGGTTLTTQESVAKIKQHQDVTQRNINNQNLALAIAIENSSAQAFQSSFQQNVNVQAAEVEAANLHSRTTSLIISGAETSERPGWAIQLDAGDETVDQSAWAEIEQTQLIDQLNFNHQSAAVAYATNDGESNAFQTSQQYNENIQEGIAEATNEASSGGDDQSEQQSDEESSSDSETEDSTENSDAGDDKEDSSENEEDSTGSSDTGDDDSSSDEQDADGSSTNEQDTDDSDENSGDSSLPGFGVGVTAVSLLGAALLALRRE